VLCALCTQNFYIDSRELIYAPTAKSSKIPRGDTVRWKRHIGWTTSARRQGKWWWGCEKRGARSIILSATVGQINCCPSHGQSAVELSNHKATQYTVQHPHPPTPRRLPLIGSGSSPHFLPPVNFSLYSVAVNSVAWPPAHADQQVGWSSVAYHKGCFNCKHRRFFAGIFKTIGVGTGETRVPTFCRGCS